MLASRRGRAVVAARVRGLCGCPYETLGLRPGVPTADVRHKYLQLARQNHPDATHRGCPERMAQINAAYERLVDPQHQAEEAAAAERRRASTAGSAALAEAGHVKEAFAAFFACGEEAAASRTSEGVARAEAAHGLFLAACEGRRARSLPSHAQIVELWSWLLRRGLVSAEACNAYFSASIRAGQAKAAMEAYRHAEAAGLEQGTHMRSYIRQVRNYKASREQG